MAKTASYSVETELGCGFMGGILQLRRGYFPRKQSVPSLPASSNNIAKVHSIKTSTKGRTRARSGARGSPLKDSSNLAKPSMKPTKKPTAAVHPRPPSLPNQKNQGRRPSDAARTSTSPSPSNGLTLTQTKDLTDVNKIKNKKKPSRAPAELARAIAYHDRCNDTKALVRATSSNVMLLGQLGNLRHLKTGHALASNSPNATTKTVDYLSRNLQDHKYSYGMMGNIVRGSSDDLKHSRGKLDSEAVKAMGNEAYKRGCFEEALALYDRAIALDSSKATYRGNRSAALIGLGRLVEAVSECKEAIRIEPSYQRARHRLATLYLRLGEADKALYHYNQLGSNADSQDIAKAQSVKKHLSRCTDALKSKDWDTLLQEAHFLISDATDSSPQVYAMRVEALMKLHRHQEAQAMFRKRPNYGIDCCTSLFGLATSAYLLLVASQVYLTTGRFDEAVGAAQHAAKLDPASKDVNMELKRVRTVSSARMSGNLLFKEGKYTEACTLYTQGLEQDHYNSVLLCNRAACRAKLGQLERAVEDCTAALAVHPCYSKARLRRADCNAKMGRWEVSVHDYEMLKRESPGDAELKKALFEAQLQVRRQGGDEDTNNMKFGSNFVLISSNDRFTHFVSSPGMCVALFCNNTKQKQLLRTLQQLCKRFPSINFLKVEVEDHPELAKLEGVGSVPTFKIYKNGLQVREIPGNSSELLESSIKVYTT